MFKTIVFTEEEVTALQRFARWRSDPKIETFTTYTNFTEYVYKKEKSYHAHYLGIAGEFAVAQYLGAFFDPIPRIKGDGHKSDVVWGEDARIAVKTTRHNPPIFKIQHMREIEDATDIALCQYNEPVLKIAWIKSKEEFLENMYLANFGYKTKFMCLDYKINE